MGGRGAGMSHTLSRSRLKKRASSRVRRRRIWEAMERMSSLIPRGHLGPEGRAALQPGQSGVGEGCWQRTLND